MNPNSPIPDARRRIQAALDWLCRSQTAAKCNGSAAYYSPVLGWGAPYPETTGYIIPTLWRGADFLDCQELAERALRMARWLLPLQSRLGWFPAGTLRKNSVRKPSVFNTGQIIFGMVEAAKRTGDSSFAEAARRAVAWLVSNQDSDGRWTLHSYVEGFSPSYYAHVCWPLLEYWKHFGDEDVRACAERGLSAVLADQNQDGTFASWGFTPSGPAFTHTIGYTLQGLVESAMILDRWQPFGESAERACHRLLRRYEIKHRLAGAYEEKWQENSRFICATGNCQLASAWMRIHAHGGDPRYLNVAAKALECVSRLQRLSARPRDLRGAIPGSAPLHGPYMRFRYPNWAAKFYADAMMDLSQILEMPATGTVPISMPLRDRRQSASRAKTDQIVVTQAAAAAGFSKATCKYLSEDRRGLAHFAESSEQVVPIPLSAGGFPKGSKRVVVLAGHQRSLASVALVAALRSMPSEAARLEAVISVSAFSAARIRNWRRRLGKQFAGRILSEFGLARAGQFAAEREVYQDHLRVQGVRHRSLKSLCREMDVPLHVVRDINSDQSIEAIQGHNADWAIYSGAGILRQRLLDVFPKGVLNLHCGPLPYVRGMNAVEWSLFHGIQPEVTLHKVDRGIDTGEILASELVDVHSNDSLGSLRARTVLAGHELLLRLLPALESLTPQENPAALGRQYFSMADPLKRVVECWLADGRTPVATASEFASRNDRTRTAA